MFAGKTQRRADCDPCRGPGLRIALLLAGFALPVCAALANPVRAEIPPVLAQFVPGLAQIDSASSRAGGAASEPAGTTTATEEESAGPELPAATGSQQNPVEQQIEAERERLAETRRQIAEVDEQLADLEQQISSSPASEVDAIAAAVKAALEKANVLEKTAKAAQQRMDALRQQLDPPRAAPEMRPIRPDGAMAGERESLVERLLKPFTVDNLADWIHDHGPPILTILFGTAIAFFAVKLSSRHLVKLVTSTGSRGTLRERENRALTLVGVFRSVATIVVLGGGALMLLDETGIAVLPLMGGAAVLGLAVAFGSQNLIRDYFSGFMLLLEDQYGLNDVVKIGAISGAVEQITLRMTVLRDIEGTVHFIPHGTITTVSNMTHGWSRAVIEIGVDYKEDVGRVMDAMLAVARELRQDDAFGPLILEDAEMLGVDALGESAMLVKMVIKTHPLKRWAVRREYLRRIKQRFDELDISIPYPHRMLLLQSVQGDESESGAHQPSQGGKTSGST